MTIYPEIWEQYTEPALKELDRLTEAKAVIVDVKAALALKEGGVLGVDLGELAALIQRDHHHWENQNK